jgi:hypothetical protein
MKWFTRNQKTSKRFSSPEGRSSKFRTWRPRMEVLEDRTTPAPIFAPAPGSPFALPVGAFPQFVALAQINSKVDSHLDMVVTDFGTNQTSIFFGTGLGTFGPRFDFLAGNAPARAGIGDFNLDGNIDIVLPNFLAPGTVSVLFGDGFGNFPSNTVFTNLNSLIGDGPFAAGLGDFNNDGLPDIVVANFISSNYTVVFGNGAGGQIGSGSAPTGGVGPVDLVVGDLTGDGISDVAFANQNSGTVSVFAGFNTGGVGLLTPVGAPLVVGALTFGVTSGLFNGDTIPDLAAVDPVGNTAVVFLGLGGGVFGLGTPFATGAGPTKVVAADINGDGLTDLVTANQISDDVSYLQGDGLGGFAAPVNYATGGIATVGIAVGDLNGDNLLDIATANRSSDDASVLLQQPQVFVFGGTVFDDIFIIDATTANSGFFSWFVAGVPVIVNAPFADITSLVLFGFEGNDTLIINNPAGGLFAPQQGIFFYGGGQPGDNIQNLGGASLFGVYSPGADNGNGILTHTQDFNGNPVVQRITFTGLAPILDGVLSPVLIVNGTPASNAINYNEGPNSNTGLVGFALTGLVSVDNFEPIEFFNKANLVINGLAGSDTININNPIVPTGMIPFLGSTITVNAGDPTGSDTVIVNAQPGAFDPMVVVPAAQGAGTVVYFFGNLPNVVYTGVENLKLVGQLADGDPMGVDGTLGDDIIEYTSGATPDTGTIAGTMNNGAFTLGNLTFSGMAQLSVLIFNIFGQQGGNDSFIFNGTNGADSINVGNLGAGAIFITNTFNGQLYAQLNVNNIVSATIRGRNGDDEISVDGNITIPISVDGGGGNDSIVYSAVTGSSVSISGDSRDIASAGFGTVGFVGVERIRVVGDFTQSLTVALGLGNDTARLDGGVSPPVGDTLRSNILPDINFLQMLNFTLDAVPGIDVVTINMSLLTGALNYTLIPSQSDTVVFEGAADSDLWTVSRPGGSAFAVTDASPFHSGRTVVVSATLPLLQTVTFLGLAGDDVLTVDSSIAPILTQIVFDGGTGSDQLTMIGGAASDDTYSIGLQPGSGNITTVFTSGGGGVQRINFSGLEPIVNLVAATNLIINGSAGNDQFNYTDGIILGSGLVTINNAESMLFSNKTNLRLNGLAGSDTFNLNNPNTPTGLTNIFVNGGDPTGSDVLIVNGRLNAADTFTYRPGTAVGDGLVTNVGLPAVNFTGVEHLQIDGRNSNTGAPADSLTLNTFNIDGTQILTPGSTFDSGHVDFRDGPNFTTTTGTPLDFRGLGIGGSISFSDVGRFDNLIYNGTAGSDTFTVNAAGQVTLNTQIVVDTPSIITLTLVGGAGDDTFNIAGNHNLPGGIVLDGGVPSSSDVLNFTASAGGTVNVNLGANQVSETGFAPVTLISVERANLLLSGAGSALTVLGTLGDDTFDFTPSAAGTGSFWATWTGAAVGASPLFTYTGVAGNITVDGGGGGFDTLGLIATAASDNINAVQSSTTALAFTLNAFTQNFTVTALEAARIDALAGDDIIRVSQADAFQTGLPGALRFTVNGGSPGGSDRLIVNDDGIGDLTIIQYGADRTAGTVTVGVAPPIDFNGVERVDITPITNSVTGGTGVDGNGRIKVFHFDPWENNDTRQFAGLISRASENPTGPAIYPGSINNPNVPGDEDWYEFVPTQTGTFRIQLLFDTVGPTLANGRPGLPGNGDLNMQIFDAFGNLIVSGTNNALGEVATFGATNTVFQFSRIFVRVFGASAASINEYDFLFNGITNVLQVDNIGPQITGIFANDDLPLGDIGAKPLFSNTPTPLVTFLTITFQDLPARAPGFLYEALDASTVTPGVFILKGDRVGVIQITSVTVINDPVFVGQVATATVIVEFANPLPDDRYTLKILDHIQDPVGNKMDGENNGFFPSGNGVSGGNFIITFVIDSAAEIGVYAGGSIVIDLNGNFIQDPNTASNGDVIFKYNVNGAAVFAGQFNSDEVKFDGFGNNFFDKIGLYGRIGKLMTWQLDTDGDGIFDITRVSGLQLKGALPIAGDFNFNPDDGDEIGLFDGKTWYLDNLGINNVTSFTQSFTGNMRGLPIVGDFDGDGLYDLGTFQNNKFYFNLSTFGPIDGNADVVINFGAFQKTARPVAADFNGDGATDIGLFVPNKSTQIGAKKAEWFIVVSNVDEDIFVPFRDPNNDFKTIPFGDDFTAAYGNPKALPIVGNFDPPANSKAANAALKAFKASNAGMDGSTLKALMHDMYFAQNSWRHN